METYTDFGVSYLIQNFVNKINIKLWNDCQVYLTDDFHYKVDQNRVILATLDSLLDHGRSSRPEAFLGKVVLKIWRKFTGEHPCWSVISIKLQSNFIVITLWHGCSPANLLHIFRIPVLKYTSEGLLFSRLNICSWLIHRKLN